MVQHFKRTGHSAIVTDLYDDGQKRWSKPILLLFVLALFVGILLYSYSRGKDAANGTVIATISPETPFTRMKPEDPEGMEIAHQDMEIYRRVDNSPATEMQIAPDDTTDELPVTDDDVVIDSTIPPYPPARLAKNTARGSRILASAVSNLEKVSTRKPVQSTTESIDKKQTATPKSEKQVALNAKVADILDTNTGPFLLQLASFGSENAAQSSWNKMKKQYAPLSKLNPRIEKINISGKGQFHRLQAGSWNSRNAADKACSVLKTSGQDCIVVKR